MKKLTLAVIVSLGLTAACEPYVGDSFPGSASSASSLGSNGLLYGLLGVAVLLAVKDGHPNNP